MRSWYVIYVRSRAEKKVAERLRDEDVEIFCPLKTEYHQWSDRKKKVLIPYFSSYIFVRLNYGSKEERLSVLQIPGVVRFLFWLKKPALIREKEMEAVMRFFENYSRGEIVKENIKLGENYRIEKGPFVGKVGVVKENSSRRAILEVPGLNLRFSVDKSALTAL